MPQNKKKHHKNIESDLQSMRDFLETQIKGYTEDALEVDTLTVKARWECRFWEVMGSHHQIEPWLYPPDCDYNETIAALGIDSAKLPSHYHLLYSDRFSAWFSDESQGQQDPPILGFNTEMDKPEVVSDSFLRYATNRVISAALRGWLYIVVETTPDVTGEPLFPSLNSFILRRDQLIILPFDDSLSVDDRRVTIYFRRVRDLTDSSIPWESQVTSLMWDISCYDDDSPLRTDILVINLKLQALAECRHFKVQGIEGYNEIYIHRLDKHRAWITRDAEKKSRRQPLRIVCDRESRRTYLEWAQENGGKIISVNGKTYKPPKGPSR